MAFSDVDIQYVYKLLVIFLYSFCATLWSVPYVVEKLKKYRYLVEDKYKKSKKKIGSMGGIAILIGILVSLALSQVLLNPRDLGELIIFYFIVLVYALYGVVDDLFHFKKRYDKIFALLILSFPLASLIEFTTINIFYTTIDLGIIYSLGIVPVYVMVVANMLNLHAGFNGLTQGLALILLVTLGIQSYRVHGLQYIVYLLPVLGGVLALLPFISYPARVLPGNVGDLMVGAAIGAFIVVNKFLWFGIFILIPHIINFIMDTWTIVIRKIPDKKFGRLRKDGTIQAPRSMKYKSLKFLAVSWWDLTERQAVFLLYGLTAVFCISGLILF